MHCYLPRKYRCPILFKVLLVVEFCFTVAALTLFGIAHPDTYRNKLWQDGSENGLNSSPKKGEYANANYEPYHTPHPWSQFITSYDLVISVLSLFFLLCKAPMFLMNVFYPPLSITTHVVLLVLYGVSAAFQAGPDTSDPKHPQRGAPWYIAKSCGVAKHPSNIGYCRQAKAAFACTIILIAIFAVHLFYAIYSSFPTQETRASHRERREQRQSIAALKEELKSPTLPFPMSPMSPMPMTPFAFNPHAYPATAQSQPQFHAQASPYGVAFPQAVAGPASAPLAGPGPGSGSGSGFASSSSTRGPVRELPFRSLNFSYPSLRQPEDRVVETSGLDSAVMQRPVHLGSPPPRRPTAAKAAAAAESLNEFDKHEG